ncbi:unnamed protein product (macronuclear) [Paramecium tetraurelia]|uniref:Uncharacterized protein n=1 Tax=Paramecium tetraurelia TaxID=5888 RepID=A0DRG9_PARTE|nr:uncharacterized protein GSPATT00019353001 [Paramecium tetraurelia]CAK85636.1 unnamed protein product [Paramecium tetraurelia]|eukprot:XP_001453033.1 hypothetical protein (macronuclear) [Paramecium tetraurelia strain d4-2]
MLQEIELTLDQILNQIDKHDDELDFSEEGGLVRIVAFDQLKLDLRKKIGIINLSKNRLKMIEEVNQFYNLRTLDASNNIIEDVKLKTQSLQMLNLQHNRLKRFPDCGPLSQLKYIDISHNSITTIQNNDIKQFSKNLEVLLINDNLIKFAHGYDIKNILEELKQLKIQTLNILRNPFLKRQPLIETAFAVTLSGILKTLNTKSIDLFVPDANFNIEEVLGDVEFIDSEPDDEDQEYAKQLCEKITKCINDPQAIVPCLRRIDDLVNRIIVQPNKADLCFLDKDPKKQQQIAEYIDSFLQNCFLFAQNQQSYVEQILKALAQLAIVRCLEIGRRCFQMVVEIVRSGTGMALIARNIIQKYSIPLLQQQKELEYVPTFVMEGILRTVEERDDEEMVPIKLAQFNFVDWLDQIMANYMKDMDNLREEQQQRDVLFLNFMAQLAEFQKFANEYHYRGIISKSLVLFKLLLKSELDEQYIGILYLINNSMKRSQICTKEVLESRQTACNFIKDVEDELRKYLFMFKKFRNSLLNPETKENKDTILLRYEKVGILIQVYGTIWKSDNIVQQQIKESFLVNELLQMATIPAIHPYLINAVAIYIRKLLKNKVIKVQQPGVDNNEIVKYICLKTHNCELLLHYLGGDYYVLMMKQLDPTIQKLTKNLSSLLNVKVHEVFRSIIKLLKFFSKNAIGYDSPISDICMEVSKNLDNNGRDEALFIVLATPSDMVRLAVVQCLLTIKVSQLDSKEIGKLVTLLGSYRNLGAGKTESVVANIMMILTKIVVGEKSSSREDFVTVFSQNATLYALDILERNQERDLLELGEDNSEYQEKVELSFGTNNFLKSLHCEPLLRENLKGLYQAQCMKVSLLNEDSLLTPETLDIDIERSFIGKQNTYLISVLFNRDALLPYKKVSDRILIRIAENLEMRPEDDVEDLSKVKNPGLYDFKEIQKIWKKTALDRRSKQTEIWDAMKTSADPFLIVENQEDSVYHISQHQLFYDQEGAINLLGFLVGRNQSAKSLSLKEYFLETFGNQLIFERMLNSINFYIREQVHEYCDSLNKQQEVKKLSTTRMNEKLTTIFQGLPMPTDPLRGFIKQKPYFNPNKIIHFPMFTKKALSITQEHITYTGIKFEERTITVCAYLRIVYALLGYCPQDQNKPNVQRQKMAEQLGQRAEYIRELTLICQWADWHNGNIGAKYLKIMNVILEYSFCAKEKSFIISFFVIAKAVRDMLDIISVKLQNEDKFPLTYDDLVLIKETCECMSKITSNLTKISYEDKIMETYEKDYLEDFQKLRIEERNQIATLINRQIDEYILLNLLPLQGFTIFLEIIVWDMQSEKSLLAAVSLDEKFFKIKSQTRSSLIKLVGLYIVKCKSLKFQILSVLTKMEVFNKKFIRQSFIQEILEDLFAFDYQLKLQSGLLNRSILIKNKDDEEQQGNQRPDYYVEHFIKCYYQTQNGLNLPSLVVVTSKYFILCEADEEISKKANPNIQFENPKLLMEFTSLKLIFKINKSQIEGCYKMEGDQRICVLYSVTDQPPPFKDEDSLEVAIIFFPKIISFMKFQIALNNIKFSDDTISQGALLYISNGIQPRCTMWAVVNPEKPIFSKFKEFHKKRMLIHNDGTQIRIFTENLEDWFFLKPDLMLEQTVNKKYAKLTSETQKKQASEQNYFKLKGTYDLSKMTLLEIDQTLHNQLNLQFGSQNVLRLLFGCDRAREIFKFSLLKSIEVKKFQINNMK